MKATAIFRQPTGKAPSSCHVERRPTLFFDTGTIVLLTLADCRFIVAPGLASAGTGATVGTTRFLIWFIPHVAIVILLAVLLCLMVRVTTHPRRPVFVQAHGEGELRSHTQSTGDVAFTVMPGAFYSFKFVVPSYHADVSIKGQFSVADRDHGIEAFVLNEQDYTGWQNGYTTYRYYDSGDVKQGAMDIPLRADAAGTYYVVFNNNEPGATAKNVKTNMSLTYRTRWWPGMEE